MKAYLYNILLNNFNLYILVKIVFDNIKIKNLIICVVIPIIVKKSIKKYNINFNSYMAKAKSK